MNSEIDRTIEDEEKYLINIHLIEEQRDDALVRNLASVKCVFIWYFQE